MKKHEIPSVVEHGKAALNFQITLILATLGLAIIAFVLSCFCIGFLLVPLVLLVPVAGLVFTIIAGIRANDGQLYKYPCSLNPIS